MKLLQHGIKKWSINLETTFTEDVETNSDIGTSSDDVDEDQYFRKIRSTRSKSQVILDNSGEEKSDCSTRDNSEKDHWSTRDNPRDNENFLGTKRLEYKFQVITTILLARCLCLSGTTF